MWRSPPLAVQRWRHHISGGQAGSRSRRAKWGGSLLGDFLRRVGADLSLKYVGYQCADGYYASINMATALHRQTIMAVKFADEVLPAKYGYPFKVRIPIKLGFKNPKWVTTILVTNRMPGGFWAERGYNWLSGS
jgi:DMSO/TMAO reductase YedYZ molybdopterin-dependent catalytic subunit